MEPRNKETHEGQESVWTRLPVLTLMVLVLIVAGLLSAMTAMRFAIRGRDVEVPDLVGVAEVPATRLLEERGLQLALEGRRFSPNVPEGLILAQMPEAGSHVKPDRGVRVLLSLGPRQYAVPDLSGSSLRSSQMLLSQRGFSVGHTLYAHTGNSEPFTVVYQSPEAGDVAQSDPAVDVLVTLGPPTPYYLMPKLTGREANDVIARIRAAGFHLAPLSYRGESGVAAGVIVRQQPSAGSRMSRNDTILLEVSR